MIPLGVLSQQDNVLIFDTFTDADSTDIEAHTPDVDTVGTGWQEAGASDVEINSNKAKTLSTGAHSVWIDSGAASIKVEADFDVDSDGANACGLWIRANNSSEGYLIAITNSQDASPLLRIYSWNGSFTIRATTTLTSEGPMSGLSTFLEITDDGLDIEGKLTISASQYTVNYSSTEYNSNSYVGFRAVGHTVDTLVDNFKASI